jgi:hypothetical protein
MKLGDIEVSGIKQVVVDRKAIWKKVNTRWVKYIGENVRGGKSEQEMHDYLNHCRSSVSWVKKPSCGDKWVEIEKTFKVWISGSTINVVRLNPRPRKNKPTFEIQPIRKSGTE